MKKPILTLFILFVAVKLACSQDQIERETWESNPTIHTIDAKYSKESAVLLQDKRKIEYTDENKDVLTEYYTLHKLIHINDDRGIEDFNKIYLGFNEKSDIIDIKARAVLPGGKVIELDKNNIKEIKEEDGNTYKIFAMDGLSKGCEVEYFYTFKKQLSFFGRETMQSVFPVLHSEFRLIGPARLRFDFKVYNGTAVPTDNVVDKKRIASCVFAETAGAEDEKYAFYAANLQRIEYKLSYNDSQKGDRMFTWNELAKRIYPAYTYYNDKEIKKVQDMIKANGWDKITDETNKIIAVENYIKKNYAYNEDLKSDDGNILANVIQNKAGGLLGMTRFYSAVFKNLDVKYQFVLTGDRTKEIVDRQFENWNNCDNVLIYFPAEGKFITPQRPDFRYPFIYPAWGATDGVFLKGTSIGNFTTAIAEIKNIDLEDYKKSYSNIESRMELNAGLDSVTMDARQIYGGYGAVSYRGAFNFSNDEQKRNITKELVKTVASTDHILFSETLNDDFEKNTLPFILHSKTKSTELIEKAGSKLLFKIGMAIGPQVEMYQEKPRQQPVNIEYSQVQERKLEFVIPNGYTITNADDLKMSETYKDNNEQTMGFVSTYEIKGNLLTVNIMEDYRKIAYPLSQFAQYRKIINQSSDFNKVVLVLEKKK